MKYMHFKASCSYTALAAMMEYYGTDTEDYRIALEMKLPWLFAGEDGAFISGPMLQGAKWFDLWLAPRGYRMEEERVSPRTHPGDGRDPDGLRKTCCCVYGI